MKTLFCAVAVLLCITTTQTIADHKPPSYAYDAIRLRQGPQIARIEGHPEPYPLLKAIGQDNEVKLRMDDILEGFSSKSLAGIALDRDKVLHERYRSGPEDNPYPGWSVTKSVTALLVGYAFCDGHIKNLDEKAGFYVPEIRNTVWGDATIRQLLEMRSGAPRRGLESGGDYTQPSSAEFALLTGRASILSLFPVYNELAFKTDPGSTWAYNNFDTLALGLVLEGATQIRLTDYYRQTLWGDFRPEHPSFWFLDNSGKPLAHAHFYLSLRDAARLGRYVVRLHAGDIGTTCLRNYLQQATTGRVLGRQNIGNQELLGYGFQTWIEVSHGNTVRMSGHQGQDIMINLETGKVIAIFSAYNAAREKMYRSDGIFRWLTKGMER